MGLDIHMQHLCLKLESILLIHQNVSVMQTVRVTLDVYTHTTKLVRKTLLTNLQTISIKQNKSMILKF